MTEPEINFYPVMGFDEKNEPIEIGQLTQNDLDVINRARGTIKDPNGFEIVTEDIKEEDFIGKFETKEGKRVCIKQPTIDISKYQAYQHPQPEQKWEKWFGRLKKIVWVERDPEIMIYYHERDKICYLHNLLKKTVIKYTYKETTPTDQELLDFQLRQNDYISFLKANDMDVEISSQGEQMNSFKIIDRWSHTDKVDVFSRITEEQRKNIILSRWIAATTWQPAIFTQIKGFLRLGQSIDEKGPLGTGRKPLIDVQGSALKNRTRADEDNDEWGHDKR